MAGVPIHLVRVTTDDRTRQLWAAATSREEAVERVLDAFPEGWTASLLGESLKVREEGLSDGLLPDEVGRVWPKRTIRRATAAMRSRTG